MKTNYQEIARLKRKEESKRSIAKQLSISRNTVDVALAKMLASDYSLEDFEDMTNQEVESIFSRSRTNTVSYVLPDYSYLSKELSKPGVTMALLWEEYCDECRLSGKQAYQLTQFKKYFREYLKKNDFSDIIRHKAGERIEIDWAGTRPKWKDPDSGKIICGYLFVGVLPFSGYGYAQVFPDMKLASWIKGHIDMFEYFGGVSKILVPDNLKAGIVKNTKEELIVNNAYRDMADYYGTVVIPTRVNRPKDKPTVEGMVHQLTMNIIGRMRNYQFFSIREYNLQLRVELDNFNQREFQKKEGSRYTMFLEMEKGTLIPLPLYPYSVCIWKKAKVANNCHVSLGKCFYSVPHEYIGETVDLKISADELEIHHNQVVLAAHKLVNGQIGVYETNPSHMPPNSSIHGEWNSRRYLNWAKQKGPFVHLVIQRLFDQVKVEQQRYKTVHAILRLTDRFSEYQLNQACRYALEHFASPNYKNIKMILTNKQDVLTKTGIHDEVNPNSRFLRGADYYGKK